MTSFFGLRLRAYVAVFRRELHAWRMLPAIGILLGVTAPLSVLLPSVRHNDPAEVRDLLATALALGLFVCVLAGLAATALTRDYVTGRIGFYLSRPVPASSLWLGKVSAALLCAAAGAAAVLLPTALLGGTLWAELVPVRGRLRAIRPEQLLVGWPWEERFSLRAVQLDDSGDWVLLLLFLALVPALAYLVGLTLQLRDRWTLVDFVALGVFGLLAGGAVSTCLVLDASHSLQRLLVGLAAVALGAALVGGWAVVRLAGGDPGRAHRVQSLLLWSLVALVVLPSARRIEALHDLGFRDVDSFHTMVPLSEPWVVAAGNHHDSGAEVRGLWNIDDGSSLKLATLWMNSMPSISPDGRWVAFPDCRSRRDDCELRVRQLPSSPSSPAAASGDRVEFDDGSADGFGIPASGSFRLPPRWALGSTLVAYQKELGEIRTFTFPGGRPGLTVRPPAGLEPADFAVSGTTLRLFYRPKGAWSPGDSDVRVEVYELDLRADEPSQAHVATWPDRYVFLPGRHGYRLKDADGRVRLVDPDAAIDIDLSPFLAESPLDSVSKVAHRRLLADGRALLVLRGEGELPVSPKPGAQGDRTWVLLDREGRESGRFFYPFTKIHGAEARPGAVWVGRFDSFSAAQDTPAELARFFGRAEFWRSELVDVETGEALLSVSGYLPLWCGIVPSCPDRPGDFGADWLVDSHGRPHRVNLDTGVVTPLLDGEG